MLLLAMSKNFIEIPVHIFLTELTRIKLKLSILILLVKF